MHQNQRIFVSWSERTCRGDLAWSPVLFMAGGDIAPPLRAFLTLDELPEILMRLPCKVNLQIIILKGVHVGVLSQYALNDTLCLVVGWEKALDP